MHLLVAEAPLHFCWPANAWPVVKELMFATSLGTQTLAQGGLCSLWSGDGSAWLSSRLAQWYQACMGLSFPRARASDPQCKPAEGNPLAEISYLHAEVRGEAWDCTARPEFLFDVWGTGAKGRVQATLEVCCVSCLA